MSVNGRCFRFREADRNIFDAIVNGEKTVETRAGEPKYLGIEPGDNITLVCGDTKVSVLVNKITKFKTIKKLLEVYSPRQINPFLNSQKELENMYYSFPNYKELIKKYGLLAFELSNI